MYGIDVSKDIKYKYASFRFFERNEAHISRFCTDNVLLMVFDGVLRFSEDGVFYEIGAGQYHIQKKNTWQEGVVPSDSPRYLYVHFDAEWCEGEQPLSSDGRFEYNDFRELMEELDQTAHSDGSYLECSALFLRLLAALYGKRERHFGVAQNIADIIARNYKSEISLDKISAEIHFSKNHIINIFRKEYSLTPFEYVNHLRIKEAERLLEVTSSTVEDIAYSCGFNNYSNFYRRFYAEHGASPTKWRKDKRKDPANNQKNARES